MHIFLNAKQSDNLLEIWPKILFIQNFDVLDLKLSFFEIFGRSKISQKIEMTENGNCVKIHVLKIQTFLKKT